MRRCELWAAVLVSAAFASWAAPPVQASCVAPILSLDHSSGATGDVVEIRGQYFGTACNDVEVDGTFGGAPLGDPQTGIMLVIVQDDLVIPLAVIDADSNYEFAVRLAIPTQLHVGQATILVDQLPATPGAVAPASGGTGIGSDFTITSESPNAGTGPTTTVLLGSTSTALPASTQPTPDSVALLGVGDPGPTQPHHDSNRLSPWVRGVIGLIVVVTLSALARSRFRATRRIS